MKRTLLTNSEQAKSADYFRNMVIFRDNQSPLIKKYTKGRCVAIRYASGMTLAEVKQSYIQNKPHLSEWKAFNEATGEFV